MSSSGVSKGAHRAHPLDSSARTTARLYPPTVQHGNTLLGIHNARLRTFCPPGREQQAIESVAHRTSHPCW